MLEHLSFWEVGKRSHDSLFILTFIIKANHFSSGSVILSLPGDCPRAGTHLKTPATNPHFYFGWKQVLKKTSGVSTTNSHLNGEGTVYWSCRGTAAVTQWMRFACYLKRCIYPIQWSDYFFAKKIKYIYTYVISILVNAKEKVYDSNCSTKTINKKSLWNCTIYIYMSPDPYFLYIPADIRRSQ